jgi:hypothetical protein
MWPLKRIGEEEVVQNGWREEETKAEEGGQEEKALEGGGSASCRGKEPW